jgi:hypothetical protein
LLAPGIAPSTRSVTAMVSCRQPRAVTVGIASQDGQPLDWRMVSITGTTSQILSVQIERDALRISFNGCGANPGSYTGSLELQATGVPPVTISVTVIVVDRVFETAVPVVRR